MRTNLARRLFGFGMLATMLGTTTSCVTLQSYIRDGDHAGVARMMRSKVDPNFVEHQVEDGNRELWEQTPLFLAIAQHDLEMVKLLVEGGADVNLPSTCGTDVLTPLMKAAVHGDLVIARYLLGKGADPTLVTDGHDLLQWLVLRRDRATDVERRAIVRTALRHIRTTAGKDAAQAALDTQTGSGWTPLTLAIWVNDAVLFDLYLSEGAATNALAHMNAELIDGVTSDEWLPIHFASWLDRDDMVARLLGAGASRDERTDKGKLLSDVREEVAKFQREQAEEEEQRAERQRQNELEEARERERNGSAFGEMFHRAMGIAASTYEESQGRSASEPIANPVDDNSFRDRMMAIHQAEGERKAREAEERRASAATAGAGRSAGSEPPSSTPLDDAASPPSPSPGSPDTSAEDRPLERQKAAEERQKAAEERQRAAEERQRVKAEERERAKAEERKRFREYLASVRSGIRLRAIEGVRCDDRGDYCVVATWPAGVRWTGSGEGGLVNVDFRARCAGSNAWSSGRIWHFVDNGGAYSSPTISPKPNCKVGDVEVEATDVRGTDD